MKKTFFFIVDTPSSRLDVFLHQISGESRTFIQEQIRSRSVCVNNTVIVKPSHQIHPKDHVHGYFQEIKTFALEPIESPLDVLYEDEDLLCLNKFQGVVVHPATGYSGPTLVHYLLHYFKDHQQFKDLKVERPGIVHRLDRGTSGALLIAKNRKTQELLSQLFKKRSIEKEYEAIVWGKAPQTSHIEDQIGRDRKERKKMSSNCEKGRVAITDFKLLTNTKTFSHLGVSPKTGRTHQIRVHLTERRLPIVGDALYGPKNIKRRIETLDPKLRTILEEISFTLLHAKSLRFIHPFSQKEVYIEASRPSIFDKFLTVMKELDS